MKTLLAIALSVSALMTVSSAEAQRNAAPAYRPPPPPPQYTPRQAPTPSSRPGGYPSGSIAGGGSQQRGAAPGNLGGYKPGSISGSNSQQAGAPGSTAGGYKPGSIANGSTQKRAQAGSTGSANSSSRSSGGSGGKLASPSKGTGTGAATQAGASAFGKGQQPAPGGQSGKAAAGTHVPPAVAGAGASLFSSGKPTPTPPGVMGGRKVGDRAAGEPKPKQDVASYCKANPQATRCQFNCASLRPKPGYCPNGGGVAQADKPGEMNRQHNLPGPSFAGR